LEEAKESVVELTNDLKKEREALKGKLHVN